MGKRWGTNVSRLLWAVLTILPVSREPCLAARACCKEEPVGVFILPLSLNSIAHPFADVLRQERRQGLGKGFAVSLPGQCVIPFG